MCRRVAAQSQRAERGFWRRAILLVTCRPLVPGEKGHYENVKNDLVGYLGDHGADSNVAPGSASSRGRASSKEYLEEFDRKCKKKSKAVTERQS